MKHTYWRYQADRTLQCTQSAIDILMNADRGDIDWARRRMFGIVSELYPVEAAKRRKLNMERLGMSQILFGCSIDSLMHRIASGHIQLHT